MNNTIQTTASGDFKVLPQPTQEEVNRKIDSAKSWLSYAKSSKERGNPDFYNHMKNDLAKHGVNIENL